MHALETFAVLGDGRRGGRGSNPFFIATSYISVKVLLGGS